MLYTQNINYILPPPPKKDTTLISKYCSNALLIYNIKVISRSIKCDTYTNKAIQPCRIYLLINVKVMLRRRAAG